MKMTEQLREKEQKEKPKKRNWFLIGCVVCSLICGIGTTILFVSGLFSYDSDLGYYFNASGLELWWVIPFGFLIGFLVPAIAYVLLFLRSSI